jgi:hypothetical protein
MTSISDWPQLEAIPGTCLKRLICYWEAYSDVLKKKIGIFPGFIYDEESTPWKGANPIGGLVHDWACRYGALESKFTAARVYHEFMKYEDNLILYKFHRRCWNWAWRLIKSSFVFACPSFIFWHKYPIYATWEEMVGDDIVDRQ